MPFRNPFFTIFGLLMIGLSGYTQMRGLGGLSPNEGKVVPKSIRDNPGSYRSHYGYYPRYTGGK